MINPFDILLWIGVGVAGIIALLFVIMVIFFLVCFVKVLRGGR